MNEIKVVFLGESYVGKTSLINRYIHNKYEENQYSTLSSTFSQKKIIYKEKEYIFNLWDTSGRQIYRALNKLFLKDVKIAVLVYDITNKQSFLELQFWLDYILEKCPDTFLILVGNKNDLSNNRKIKKSDGEKFAQVIHAEFTETSAKDDNSWNDFLEDIFMNYLKQGKVYKNNDSSFGDDND